MSRGQSQRRTDSRKIALERCKSKGKEYDVIDIDSDRIPNFIIIDAPESSDWTFVETSTSGKDKIPVYRNIIFVDDDDDNDESGDCGSSQDGFEKDENQDANFTARNKYQPSCNQGRKFSSESSKCRASCSRKISSLHHQKFPSNLSFENGDSDCDIVEDYMGNIRRQWEEASLRKKRNVLKGQSGCQDEVDPLLFTNSQNLVDVIKTAEACNANHQNNNLNNMVDVKTPEEPSGNYQNNNFNPSACVGEDTIGGTSNKSDLEETFQPERCKSSCCSTQVVKETTLKPLANTQSLISINPSTELSSGDGLSDGQHCIIGNREMLKKTNAYKRAEEEEWASRQRELEIQAKEARRLRKRRKAETLRLLETERRQKQRVEEVREAQKKDKETLNLKEQLRSEVRREIDKLEVNCNDMASLLHGLGIDVGGLFPSPSEVRAAYKQALLKFHPDRASRSDIRQQIEAEEKFKLISRAKERFML